MPICKEHKCPMKEDCAITGCLLSNPLIVDQSKEIYEILKLIESKKKRIKYVINLFQEKRPPKINRRQIDRYFLLRKHKGIDLDKDYIGEREKEYHANLKHVPTKKEIKIDYSKAYSQTKNKGKKKKKSKGQPHSIVGVYLSQKKKFEELAAKQSAERKGVETVDEFFARREREAKTKELLSAPQENFHEE